MITINWQAIVTQVVALILLVWLLKRMFFQTVLNTLDDRTKNVADTYAKMEENQRAMEEARRDYEQRLRGIEEEARAHIQAAVKEAQQLREQIMSDAHQQGEGLIQHAREEIEREKRTALLELRTEVAELAVGAASKILGRSIDAQSQRDLLQDFIRDVGQA